MRVLCWRFLISVHFIVCLLVGIGMALGLQFFETVSMRRVSVLC